MITVHVEVPGDAPFLAILSAAEFAVLDKVSAASRKGRSIELEAGNADWLLSLDFPLEQRGAGWRLMLGTEILRVPEGCVVPCSHHH